jgi:ferric-dicitrate binding protein FerR (iron transport regulator)
MTRDHDPLTPEQEHARDAVREFPPMVPDSEFLARLKSDFVEGRLEQRERFQASSRARWAWAVVPLAAAAALALFLLRGVPERPVEWAVLGASESGTLQWGESTHELAALTGAKLATDAGPIRVEGGWIEIGRPGTIGVRLNPGTDADLDASDWELRIGELQVLTGPGFEGQHLVITTPEGRTEVVGTAFAVFRDEGVTCVCVTEGVARIGVDEADLEEVTPGFRKVMFGDGRAPEILDIMPDHRVGLEKFLGHVRGTVEDGSR